MSKKIRKKPRFADLKEQCSNLVLQKGAHTLLVSAPHPSATLSTALLGRAILKSGGLFHIKHLESTVNIEKINELRKRYTKSDIIVVDITIFGKKRLRKGQNYPLFIGGTSELEQVQSQTIGFGEPSSVVSYALAAQKMSVDDYELMLSVLATLIHEHSDTKLSKASRDLIKIAKEQISDNNSQLSILLLIAHDLAQSMRGRRKASLKVKFFLLCTVFVAYFK